MSYVIDHILRPIFNYLCHDDFIINKTICADGMYVFYLFFFFLSSPCCACLFFFPSAIFLEMACHLHYVFPDGHQSHGSDSLTSVIVLKNMPTGAVRDNLGN